MSQKLHLWIDLIFGDAQQGAKAVERANVFYHLTYEGAVDVEAIEDDEERDVGAQRAARPRPPAPAGSSLATALGEHWIMLGSRQAGF